MNIVISDKKTGKALNTKTEKNIFMGKKIGEEIDLSGIGMLGYKGKISGGSDMEGFPMKHSLQGMQRKRVLLEKGIGFRPTKIGERKKKTVAGNTVSLNTAQLNLVISHYGAQAFEELLKTIAKPAEKREESVKEKLIKESLERAGTEELEHVKVKGKVRG